MTVPLYTLEPLTDEQRDWLHARIMKRNRRAKKLWRKAEPPFGDPRKR